MNKTNRTFLRLMVLLALVAVLVAAVPVGMAAPSSQSGDPGDPNEPELLILPPPDYAPIPIPDGVLPAVTCVPWTAPNSRQCHIWARPGTLSMPDGASVPFWGFSNNPSAAVAPTLPGPSLIVNQGETVYLTFFNQIPGETLSLMIPGTNAYLRLNGIPFGSARTLVFQATEPGTYIYEPEPIGNGTRQAMMGLWGAFIVRPAGQPLWAYDASTAFNDEELLALSEIDPAFNADPLNFNLSQFKPKYWLLNGRSYTQTTPISTAQGNNVLLRYVNGGVQERSLSLLGVRQKVVAFDGNFLTGPKPFTVVGETLGAGNTMDTLVSIPAAVSAGTRYPLYNAGLQQNHNNGAAGFGGIVTFLDVVGGSVLPDVGPLASNVLVTPNPTSGLAGVTLSADLSEMTTGSSNVVAAEYFTTSVGTNGTGVPLSIPVPGVTVNVNATISAASLSLWNPGKIPFYVHGQDANGNWGPFSSDVLDLQRAGPTVRGIVLTPNPTNGSVDVALRATGDATLVGNTNVISGEYFIDTPGATGTGSPMTANIVGSIVELSAVIPQATVNGLSEGIHTIHIHALDGLGNWGVFSVSELKIDQTGPAALGISIGPNPNNGTLTINSSANAMRAYLTAGDSLVSGVNSNIDKFEGFIDTAGTDGSGFPIIPADALFDSTLENGYVNIPLSQVRILSEGTHTLIFHAKDKAGNWGPNGTLNFVVDKTGPLTSNLFVTPNPTGGAANVNLTALVTDGAPNSNIVAAEWYEGPNPGAGFGNPMIATDGTFDSSSESVSATINVSGWTNGFHTIYVRGRDMAGTWGPTATVSLGVSGNVLNLISSDGFENSKLQGWTAPIGQININRNAAMQGSLGMQAYLKGDKPAFLTDLSPMAETVYRASFWFNPNGTETAGNPLVIFAGKDGEGKTIFGIRYQMSASGPEIQAWSVNGPGVKNTSWHRIGNAAQQIEVSWNSDPLGMYSLVVDGETKEILSNLDTSSVTLDRVLLGPSEGMSSQASGFLYFDGFISGRDLSGLFYKLFLPFTR